MQTKTLSNLVLEFPALEKSKGKALKGGSNGFLLNGIWVEITWGNGWYQGGQATAIPGVTVTPGGNYSTPGGGTSPYPYGGGGGYGDTSGGGGSYGGGTSGGGGDSTNIGNYLPFTMHHIISPLLPHNDGSQTQLKNHCLFKAMEVANHYNGGTINYGAILQDYAQISGNNNAFSDGFTGSIDQLKSFVSSYFETNIISNYSAVPTALDLNHVVLGTVYTGNGIHHEIVVTGYDNLNGNLRLSYFDPQTGFYVYGVPYDQILNPIEITGNK